MNIEHCMSDIYINMVNQFLKKVNILFFLGVELNQNTMGICGSFYNSSLSQFKLFFSGEIFATFGRADPFSLCFLNFLMQRAFTQNL